MYRGGGFPGASQDSIVIRVSAGIPSLPDFRITIQGMVRKTQISTRVFLISCFLGISLDFPRRMTEHLKNDAKFPPRFQIYALITHIYYYALIRVCGSLNSDSCPRGHPFLLYFNWKNTMHPCMYAAILMTIYKINAKCPLLWCKYCIHQSAWMFHHACLRSHQAITFHLPAALEAWGHMQSSESEKLRMKLDAACSLLTTILYSASLLSHPI